MKRNIYLIIIFVFLISCNKSTNTNEEKTTIKFINKPISFVGDLFQSEIGTSVKIDSITSVKNEIDNSDLSYEIKNNSFILNNLPLGYNNIKAKVYSNGKVFNFADSIYVQMPQAIIQNNWGCFLVLNEINKLMISVPGYTQDKIVLNCKKYNITNSDGRFLIKPIETGEVTLIVSVIENNKIRTLGSTTYKVFDKNTKISDIYNAYKN